MSSEKLFSLIVLLSASFSVAVPGFAQTSPLDIATPNSMASGSPVGTSAVSPLEGIDLSNGNLNFVVPLHQVGGAGRPGYTMQLPISTKWTIVNAPSGGMDFWYPTPTYIADGFQFGGFNPRYTPGRVVRRDGTDTTAGTYYCASPSGPGSGYTFYQGDSLTKILWIDGTGTEHEFLDSASSGAPNLGASYPYGCSTDPNTGGPDRGKIFESDDSQGSTFYADNDVYDDITTTTETHNDGEGVAGWILFKDGSRYQVNFDGYIVRIEDRNGNYVTLSYSLSGSTGTVTITDSLDRTTTVTYASGYDTIQYPPSRTITVNWGGSTSNLRSGYSPETYPTLFPPSYGGSTVNIDVVTSIVLADSSQYQFQYNSYGELARATLPTGGAYEYDLPTTTDALSTNPSCQACYYSYNYSGLTDDEMAVWRRLVERRVYPDGSTLEGRTTYSGVGSLGTTTTTVTEKDASMTPVTLASQVHYFWGDPTAPASNPTPPGSWYTDLRDGKEYETQWMTAGGSLLRTMQYNWGITNTATNDINMCQTTATLPKSSGAIASGTLLFYDIFSNQSDLYEYDFGSAPSMGSFGICPTSVSSGYTRHTNNTYVTSAYSTNDPSGAVYSNHMRNLPDTTKVFDGGSSQVAQTSYIYDGGSLTTESSPFGHTDPSHSVRGNLTALTRYISSGSSVSSNFAYDNLGNVLTATDPRSHSTTYSYTDVCDVHSPGVSTYAFPTTVTNALSQATLFHYDCATGNTVRVLDPNFSGTQSTVASSYSDPLERVTNQTHAAGVTAIETQTNYTYPDTKTVDISSDRDSSGDGIIYSQTITDGLGRPKEDRQYVDSSHYIDVVRAYDALGRLYRISAPYRTDTETALNTTMAYDELNRVVQETASDISSVTNTAYDGNTVTVTDPAGVARLSIYDGLGRLTSVQENPSGSGPTTSYTYGTLDTLLTVAQSGLSTACDSVHSRVFAYDWLKRLTSACNPESGTIAYTYDGNGNLSTRTDARSVVSTYSYDNIDRITGKSYSGSPGAPSVSYTYDSITNSIGRLTQMTSSASTDNILAYDKLGRVTSSSQVTGSTTYSFPSYAYNRASALTSVTYPSGRVVTMANFDKLGRIGSVSSAPTSSGISSVFAGSIGYASQGPINSITMGNGIVETTTFNTRLQPATITATNSTTSAVAMELSLYYCYSYPSSSCSGNNGNLVFQQIQRAGMDVVQSYIYDWANRVSGAGECTWSGSSCISSTWSQTFGYDNFGNRAVTASIGTGTVNPVWTATATGQFNTKNQLIRGTGDVYDVAGNMTSVASSASSPNTVANTMGYDAENRMLTANIGMTGTVNYGYDGDGKRVSDSATGTVFVYDATGQLAAEYSTTALADSGTLYMTPDSLGSTRLVTDAYGAVLRCYDYMPFGEEVPNGVGPRGSCYSSGAYPSSPDAVSEKFTGKERDAESGLDYFGARYLSSAQGRFTSIDPSRLSAFFDSPQSWNMYTYAYNNPLRFVDKNGMWPTAIHNQIIDVAFPNLTPEQRQILKDVSAQQDSILGGGQGNSLAFQHAMRSPGQTPKQAEALYKQFVQQNEDQATRAQVNFWAAGNPGFSNDALKKFAAALHAILDSTSPAHAGFQKWDWRNLINDRVHSLTESSITPGQLTNAALTAQSAFVSTFGYNPFDWLQLQTSQTEPQPAPPGEVTTTIWYMPDDGTQGGQ